VLPRANVETVAMYSPGCAREATFIVCVVFQVSKQQDVPFLYFPSHVTT
jgi:hypothetical protein